MGFIFSKDLVSLGPALHVGGQAAGIPAAFIPRLCGVGVHAVRLLSRADVARRGHDVRGPPWNNHFVCFMLPAGGVWPRLRAKAIDGGC